MASSWGTASELTFIDKLGTGKWSDRFIVGKEFRIEMLQGYLEGLEKRKRWDGINKEIVINYTESLIEKIRNGKIK